MTFWTKNSTLYMLYRDPSFQYWKYLQKYKKVESPERAYRRNEFSKMINVPIEISTKNRRSRVHNKQIASRSFRNIEQFNEHYNLDVKFEDLPTQN